MRILYVTTVSSTMNAFLIPHIKMLVDKSHQVDVAFNLTRPLKNELEKLITNVHQLEFSRFPIRNNYLKLVKDMKAVVVEGEYDIVHTHTPIASLVVRLACRNLKNVKVIYTAHGFHFFEGAPKKNWSLFYPIEKFLSKYTDVLITMNEEDYQLASKKLYANRIAKVNGVGIDLSKFNTISSVKKNIKKSSYGFKKDDFILIYVAELSYRKNQEDLIKAISNLNTTIPNIKLLLIGEGPSAEKHEKLVSKLELAEHVKLLGYRTDIPSLMSISDVIVSTSRQEGLPVNIMEGMASGLPAVVTNSRGNRDLIENNLNGFVVELHDVQTFSNKIQDLHNDKELRKRFSEHSLKKIHSYSIENVLEEMKEIYSKLE